jgi:PAS domain S-box-containing protein
MPVLSPEWNAMDAFEALFEKSSDGLLLYGPDLRIQNLNRTAEKLLAMRADEVIGRSCDEVFGCLDCASECGLARGLRASVAEGTVRIGRPQETPRVALVTTLPLHDQSGGSAGAVAIIREVHPEHPAKSYEIVAESVEMRELMALVKRIGPSAASTILLEGESGTGKDLVARILHQESHRSSGAFIAINCAAIPETLIESELFGHERGAFTDARQRKRGLFELAHGGTLFLDEIGEIPPQVQTKLLRVLEDRSFRRIGGLEDLHVDVRFIAATNRDLREAVKEGAFRQDLYFRINVINLSMPALRTRREDILPLAKFFIEHYNRKFKRHVEGLSRDAEAALLSHSWPGNVRELKNAIERAMILEETSWIRPDNLPRFETSSHVLNSSEMSLEEHERHLVAQALSRTGGNQTQAARLLGVTRDTLRYKMKKYGLH